MLKVLYCLLFGCFLLVPGINSAQTIIFELSSSIVSFHSAAPNELVSAASDKMMGILDNKNFFLFKVDILTFKGFNSPVQREHFNENYMETSLYTHASYSGKIIEDVDLVKEGVYDVRAKGKLDIHGIKQEQIIKVHIVSKNGKLAIKSNFKILLADYNIKIPRIVSDKLSPVINVKVDCIMVLKK